MIARPQRADAWFVRVRQGARYRITPCTRHGWAATIGYMLFSLALAPVLLPPEPVRVAAWLTLFLATTALFLVVAWRTSSPAMEGGEAD